MQYDIRLSGTPFDDGGIDLQRLELLAASLQDIAKGALQMRMFGTSVKKGRDTQDISQALTIRLRQISQGSTILHLECNPFKETLRVGVQGNLFHQAIIERLPSESPISLVMDSFRAALDPEDTGDLLDKHLLRSLQQFKKVFLNEAQMLRFSNQGSQPDLHLQLRDFSRLKQIEDQIPAPRPIIVSGVVEELKYSNAKVTFIPDQGRAFTGFLGEKVRPTEMAGFWGQKATIRGTAHYKANGLMAYVEIDKVALATESDAYFSRVPRRETVAQQLERQRAEGKGRLSSLLALTNAWEAETWETSLEDDLKMLSE
jgi:hypothetical protein